MSVDFFTLAKKNSEKKILFIIASKRTKHMGINSTKEVQGLYPEKYKTLLKEMEEDLNK